MKTWIAENQVAATIIILLILAGLAYLIYYLMGKYGKTTPRPNTNDTTEAPAGQTEAEIVTGGRGRVASAGASSSGGSAPAMAGAGARISNTGGVKH